MAVKRMPPWPKDAENSKYAKHDAHVSFLTTCNLIFYLTSYICHHSYLQCNASNIFQRTWWILHVVLWLCSASFCKSDSMFISGGPQPLKLQLSGLYIFLFILPKTLHFSVKLEKEQLILWSPHLGQSSLQWRHSCHEAADSKEGEKECYMRQ